MKRHIAKLPRIILANDKPCVWSWYRLYVKRRHSLHIMGFSANLQWLPLWPYGIIIARSAVISVPVDHLEKWILICVNWYGLGHVQVQRLTSLDSVYTGDSHLMFKLYNPSSLADEDVKNIWYVWNRFSLHNIMTILIVTVQTRNEISFLWMWIYSDTNHCQPQFRLAITGTNAKLLSTGGLAIFRNEILIGISKYSFKKYIWKCVWNGGLFLFRLKCYWVFESNSCKAQFYTLCALIYKSISPSSLIHCDLKHPCPKSSNAMFQRQQSTLVRYRSDARVSLPRRCIRTCYLQNVAHFVQFSTNVLKASTE